MNLHTQMRKISFSPPDIGEDEIKQVVETLHSGWITTGPKTKEFERRIAQFCHTDKAVCLNSATAALELTLRILGIGAGDEVIVPAYTYTATASVGLHVGATIVMVDSQKDSVEMDYDQLEQAITPRTKVIIPVDLGGIVCDYDRIFRIVEKKSTIFHPTNDIQKAFGRCIVLADAAHAFGAQQNGKMCGEIADFSTFSFHAVKNLTTAEGGAVVWRNIKGISNEDLYQQYQLLSLHGQNKDALTKTKMGAWEYDIIGAYYKCNMTDIMASIGLAQIERYPAILARRKEIITRYNQAFSSLPVTILNHYSDSHASSGHLYLVRLNGKDIDYRNRIIERMAERGIATNVHYKPLPMMAAYKAIGMDIENFPNAYNLFKNEITLPLHTCLSDEDINYVIEHFTDIINTEK